MLGYTNLESEKGFLFFQKFMKENGILDDLEKAGIEEGDTVRMYGFEFDYYIRRWRLCATRAARRGNGNGLPGKALMS